ncbi:hypothetical protein K438DRAFT_528941 [Mycena galopus ATCC 62051]|nr:hypothetical protein K438DRAFT_528941 [Mycena galopus ATCC 62051]
MTRQDQLKLVQIPRIIAHRYWHPSMHASPTAPRSELPHLAAAQTPLTVSLPFPARARARRHPQPSPDVHPVPRSANIPGERSRSALLSIGSVMLYWRICSRWRR